MWIMEQMYTDNCKQGFVFNYSIHHLEYKIMLIIISRAQVGISDLSEHEDMFTIIQKTENLQILQIVKLKPEMYIFV